MLYGKQTSALIPCLKRLLKIIINDDLYNSMFSIQNKANLYVTANMKNGEKARRVISILLLVFECYSDN